MREAAKNTHGSSFARSVSSQEAKYFTLMHVERDPVNGVEVAEPFRKLFTYNYLFVHTYTFKRDSSTG